jgi:biotin transporter BioY
MNFYLGKAMTVKAAIITGTFPFILTDLLYSLLIAVTAAAIVPLLKKLGLVGDLSS